MKVRGSEQKPQSYRTSLRYLLTLSPRSVHNSPVGKRNTRKQKSGSTKPASKRTSYVRVLARWRVTWQR